MALIKISELTEETTPADSDLVPIVDVSTSATKKTTRTNLFKNPPLADTSITPAMLYTGTGTSWVWQSYTATLTNITLSSGTKAFYWTQIGKTVHFYFKFSFNSSTVSGLMGVSLPVAASTRYSDGEVINCNVTYYDSSVTTFYYGKAHLANTRARLDFYVNNAASTYLVRTATSSTVPMTWAASDTLTAAGTYEAA